MAFAMQLMRIAAQFQTFLAKQQWLHVQHRNNPSAARV
jgi:hypothetical protein